MMRRLVLAIAAVFSAAPALAENGLRTGEVVAAAGVICAGMTTGQRDAPDTISGRALVIDRVPQFAAPGTLVPAVIGMGFGVMAQTSGDLATDSLTVVLTHPPMGPDNIRRQQFTSHLTEGAASFVFFHFDHQYELVTGRWTLTAMSHGDIAYRVAFDIVAPQDAPELATLCDVAPMS